MKICHITTVHTSRYDDRIFEKECVSLAAAGFETCLIVNDDLPDETISGVRIISLRTKAKRRTDRITRIAGLALEKALEVDAEIYQLHDPELLRIGKKLRKAGKKVIFDSHEFTAEQILTKKYLPGFVRGTLSRIYRKYESNCLRQMSGIIVPCTFEGKDYFAEIDRPKVLIDNRPVLTKYRESFRETENREDSACYIGSITEARGAVQMVKAAGIAGRKLVLIGSMPEELREQLEAMPECAHVEYRGEMKHEEAMRTASRSKVGLALLHNEGQYAKIDNLPVKLYEYMMMGLPTVISDFPYYKKVLQKYLFGIAVDPLNEEEIAAAINRIIEDKELQDSMAKAGREAILKEMNWEKEAEKLIQFYRDLQ